MAPATMALALAAAALAAAPRGEPMAGEEAPPPIEEAAPQPAQPAPPVPIPKPAAMPRSGGAKSIKLIAYDPRGRVMDVAALLNHIGRADRASPPAADDHAIWVTSPDGLAGAKARLDQNGTLLTLSWERLPRVVLSLPWPVAEDGFSTVWADKGGKGFSDGEVVYLNEEIALTQHRHFSEAWLRHSKDRVPSYEPGGKARKLHKRAQEAVQEALAAKEGAERAAFFDKALQQTALAWQTFLFEHGLQLAHNERTGSSFRFGLTLDESLVNRLDYLDDIVAAAQRSGANWVRLVFRSNPADFTYSRLSSFNEYDSIVKRLREARLRVMGCVLDTTQWPSTLTPEIYAERVKNIALHYRGQIQSWEVGSEINGDWLGGRRTPLGPERTFRIFAAGAAQVKEIERTLETVATLYWWDGTAPDREHSLFGWLARYAPRGFADNLDIVGVSLYPEDNPVGTAFERIFERLGQLFPEKRVMLSSFGYVEGSELKGYWWLDPADVDGARKDLVILYSTASCAAERSLCGGFWWQTLDQMMPAKRRVTDLYRVYRRVLQQLGR